MPTYTYECKKCTSSFELFHSMSATPRVKCVDCGGPCRRLIGRGAGLIFKGSGFYETDYKKKSGVADSGNGGGKTDSKAEAKSESSPETKSESKPETKSESKSETKSESRSGTKSSEKASKSARK
ncbi:MAG: zinc ribbon domain-containing protein [Candidatus Hydrogenedentes bacterium]|nr:zinc ribbon domain-containing protein [Candidatus Hydrogenedentota bacterium]